MLISRIMEQENFAKKLNQKIGLLKPGWWIVHLVAISAVYALGHFLWR
jgi:hypothetical protein